MPIKVVLITVSLINTLSGCSINKTQQTTESKRIQFEQSFAEQCVEKEVRNSINKDVDRIRFSKPCACIAKRIANHLPEREMEKFLLEHKITHSLTMSSIRPLIFAYRM